MPKAKPNVPRSKHKTKQKPTLSSSSSVCNLNSSLGSRQVSLLSFFGQPTKKVTTSAAFLNLNPKSSLPPPTSTTILSKSASFSNLTTSSPPSLSKCTKNFTETNSSSLSNKPKSVPPSGKKKKKSSSNGGEQLYLDFGQSSFGKRTECPQCGTLYVDGVAEDRIAHDRVCRDFQHGVALRILPAMAKDKSNMVVQIDPDTFVIEVKQSHKLSLRRKAQEVRKIAEQELGFVSLNDCHNYGNDGENVGIKKTSRNKSATTTRQFTYFLYVAHHHVVGLLATERITEALATTTVVDESSSSSETSALCCTGKVCRASLGVHLLWVHQKHRGIGIATKLLDLARERSVYGYTMIPLDQIAFSSPTEAGLGFARAYTRDSGSPVLIYQYKNCAISANNKTATS